MHTLFMATRHNFGKFISSLLLIAGLFAISSSPLAAKCTEEEVGIKLFYSLGFRGQLMENDEMKVMMYKQAGLAHFDRLGELEGNIQTGVGDRDENIDLICKELDSIIAITDDILAGGNGTGKRLLSPWKKYTPEDLLRLQTEYDEVCEEDSEDKCYNYVANQLEMERDNLSEMMKNNKIKYPAYVDQLAENFKKAIENAK